LRHQLPDTDYVADTPAGDFGSVAGAGRPDSGAAHTGKHLIASVHLGDVRCPGTGLGAAVVVADCSLKNVLQSGLVSPRERDFCRSRIVGQR